MSNKSQKPSPHFLAELKRFTDRFGTDGAMYFSHGLDYTAALEQHLSKVEAQLKSALGEKAEIENRIRQLAIC